MIPKIVTVHNDHLVRRQVQSDTRQQDAFVSAARDPHLHAITTVNDLNNSYENHTETRPRSLFERSAHASRAIRNFTTNDMLYEYVKVDIGTETMRCLHKPMAGAVRLTEP
ncbi:hypothetical protein EVAR_26080_1 [Eumeta japonica]|uniref:Uncharacterized protein n=1 Tax=Eumeta variegata TaxID=151549 RepID=A0A4C1X171_EUMVA|nr:hypothetical protein EVAR_26080_1 [Eumeta japonica]